MLPIHLDENEINKFCGRPVCVVTKDGRRYVGRLSSCADGKLILNDNPFHAQSHSTIPIITDNQMNAKSEHKKKKNINSSGKKKKPKGKASSDSDFHFTPNFDNQSMNPYGGNHFGAPYPENYPEETRPRAFPPPYPYPPFRGAFGFDLAAIAFLFLLLL